ERYQSLGPGMAVTGEQRRPGEDRYAMPAAKVSSVSDRYSELVLSLAEPGGEKRRLEVIVRAYDDGVAFRYRLPAQPGIASVRLVGEL
ncbi:glycoside hydrolase family 97 N-terminal domain-containing protein, partial [Staphylococcus aureus]|nr:glycoside hydrolase family 97 N-terminal domain-containing protein [Staphylococcus aureus]